MVYVGHIMSALDAETDMHNNSCYPVLLLLIISADKLESKLWRKSNVIITLLQVCESFYLYY